MERKKLISLVTEENSSEEALQIRKSHMAKGYRMTNMKETMLHSPISFKVLEDGAYAVKEELKKHIPARAVVFLSYFISTGNQCLVCGNYFKKLIADMGITDLENFAFTEEERDLLEFATAVAVDPNNIPDDTYEKLQARYDEETLVLIVSASVLTLANNYWNNIVGVELDDYLAPYRDLNL